MSRCPPGQVPDVGGACGRSPERHQRPIWHKTTGGRDCRARGSPASITTRSGPAAGTGTRQPTGHHGLAVTTQLDGHFVGGPAVAAHLFGRPPPRPAGHQQPRAAIDGFCAVRNPTGHAAVGQHPRRFTHTDLVARPKHGRSFSSTGGRSIIHASSPQARRTAGPNMHSDRTRRRVHNAEDVQRLSAIITSHKPAKQLPGAHSVIPHTGPSDIRPARHRQIPRAPVPRPETSHPARI